MQTTWKRAAAAGIAAALFALTPIAASEPPSAPALAQDQAAKLDELVAGWQKAQSDFQAQYRKAKTNEERRAMMDKQPKAADHLPGFVELAEAAAGSETAAKAWVWVLKLAPQAEDTEVAGVALEALLRDHAGSTALGEVPGLIGMYANSLGVEKAEGALRDLIARASLPAVVGGAKFELASLIDEQEPAAGSERAAEVRALMEAVAKEYADVKNARGQSVGKRAEAWLFEKDHLQVGQVAPEIEGADLSGVAFKLSDYRGKVVLLDFWGNW